MKRVIVFCFLLLSIMFIYGQFENTIISVSDAMVEEGETIQIEVSTTEVLEEWDVISFQFDLSFDESLLQYEGVTLGDMPLPASVLANEFEPGTLRVAYANYLNISGEGNLVILEFSTLSTGTTTLDMYDFKYNSTFLEDENQIDGTVTVIEPNPFSDVTISVDSPEVNLTDPFDLSVLTSELTTEMGAISFQFELVYDTDMMTFTGTYGLGDVPNPGNFIANENESGVIAVAYANVMPITGSGSLCALEFVSTGIEGVSEVSINYFRYNASNLLDLLPGTVNFVSGPQEIEISKELVAGWNWFSINVAGDDMSINTVLASLGDNALNIKSQTAVASFVPGPNIWLGSLTELDNESLYKINVANATTLEFSGLPVDLDETTYELSNGWNYVSFAPQESEAINHAFGSIENGDKVKSQNQIASYINGAGWLGSLTTLNPLDGYMLKMTADEEFNYPEPVVSIASANEESISSIHEHNDNRITRDPPDWPFDYHDYEWNFSMWAVVEVDGVEVVETDGMLGCFVGDECRGIAQESDGSFQYYSYFDRTLLTPVIYSNVTSGETVNFYYYDAGLDDVYEIAGTVPFEANTEIGSYDDPYIFAVSTSGPAEPHFTTIWSGEPLFPHNITVLSATINGTALEAGDEVAVFDVDGDQNEICVGVTEVEGASPYVVTASWDSYLTPGVVDGFVIGHPVIYRIWDASAGIEITDITATPIPTWTGLYEIYGNTQVVLEAEVSSNIPPVADAGEDQTVFEGDIVQLDGTGSYDPDAEESREVPNWEFDFHQYEYNCNFQGIATIDGVECDDINDMLGIFVGDEIRGIAQQSDNSVMYISYYDRIFFLPAVFSDVTSGEIMTFKYYDASADMIYDLNDEVEFVSNQILGDYNDPYIFEVSTIEIPDLEFAWTAPAGIELSDATSAIPTFTAPEVEMETPLTFSLMVSDGEAWSEADEVIIYVENSNIVPVADAGEDQTVLEGDIVQLDGTGSYDPDAEESREVPDWEFDFHQYEYNCNFQGIATIDGVECDDINDMLGIFVGDEIRGIAQQSDNSVMYISYYDRIFFLPAVFSDIISGEIMTFKYYDASADMIYDLDDEVEFVSNQILGDYNDPYIFEVVTIEIPDLEFAWTAPEGIELSDATSAIPTFIAPEVEAETPFTFSLIVSDGEAWSTPDEVVITVQNGNEAPVIELPDYFMFDEDENLSVDFANEGYIWDPDLNDLSLSVAGNDNISVEITGGVVFFSAPENWNGAETLTFTVDDNQERLTASDDVNVIVNPVNDAPEFSYTEPAIEFNEDETAEVDFTEYINDVDGDALNMYVNQADEIISEIDGFVITFSAPENWNGTDAVIIGVTDNQGRETSEINVDIIVLPVNDAPTIDLPEMVEIEEDTTWEFDLSPYVNDIDGDALEVSNISIYDGTPGWLFNSEVLMVYITPPENYNDNVEVGITITDNVARETAEDMMWLNILPVNDPPYVLMELPDLEVIEDFEMITTDLNEYFADVDGDALTFESVYNAEEVSVTIIDNIMYIESVENWAGTTSVTINAYDGQERDMVSDTFEILVTEANDPPYVYNEIPDMELDEDFAPIVLLLSDYFTDPDDDLSNYWAEYNVDAVTIEITDGELVMSSIENWNGEFDVTVFVDDNIRLQAEDTFHIIVDPVNDAPVIFLPEMFSFDEDGMLEEDFSAYIEDIDDDELYLEAQGNDNINVEIEGLFVTFSAAENWNGSEDISFSVSDEFNRLIAEDVVTVEVNPVNDAPTLELPEMLSFAEDGNLEEDFSAYVNDVDGDPLTLEVNGFENIIVDITDLNVSFSAPENWNGSENLTFTVSDGSTRLMAEDEVIIEVTPVNDAPTIDLPEMFTFAEDGMLEIDFSEYINDVDGDELVVDYIPVENVLVSIDGLIVTLSAVENWFGQEMITFTVDDNVSRILAEDDVTVEVTSVNDNPVAMTGGPYSNQANSQGISEISLDGSGSYDIDGEIVSWEWNWDGGSGSGEFLTAEFPVGETTVTLLVTDNENGTDEDFTTVTVTPYGNIAPIAINDAFEGNEDEELLGNVLDNDEDPDNYPEPLTVELITDVENGTLELIGDGSFSYMPEENWYGEVTFTYHAYDGMVYSAEAQVTLTVMPVNDPPELVMVPEDIYLNEDFEPYQINLEEYFTDIDEDILTYSVEYNQNEIVLTELRGGLFEITSILNWFGESPVELTVSDGEYLIETGFTVYVEPVNDAPTINLPELFSFEEDGLLEEDFSAYVYDVDGDVLSLGYEGNENIYVDIIDLMVTFTVAENWNGSEDITFMVYDDTNRLMAEDVVTVEVTPVNDAPTINLPDIFTFAEDSMLVEDFSGYVEDIDSDVLTLGYDGNENILIEIEGMIVTFTASENWNGSEEISFMIYDEYERLMAEDIVTVEVTPVNDAPTIELPEMLIFAEDEMLEEDFSAYVYDVDGDVLSLGYEGNENIYVDLAELMVTFTAAEDWNGSEDITFMVYDDSDRLMAEDIVTVEVTPVNDAPTISLPESFTFAEDDMLQLDFTEYVSDIEGDELELSVSGNDAVMVEILGLMVTFTADENWNGEETLTFTIDDGIDRLTASDEVDVIVTSVNDDPMAEAGGPYYGQADEEGNAEIFLNGSGSYDIDGNIISWEWNWDGGQASGETVSTVFPTGVFEIELTVTDNEGGFATDTAMVTVSGYENIPPVAEADNYEGDEDTVLYGNVLFNDVDPDEYPEALSAELITNVNNGELTINADGEFEYTPNENWNGQDSFEYRAFDGLNYSETILVGLTVNPVNDSPELVEELEDLYFDEDFEPYQMDISENFYDVDEDNLSYNYSFSAEEILLENLGNGLLVLESVDNWFGESMVEVSVSDGEYTVETGFVVYVNSVNDDPSIDLPDNFTMDEGILYEVDFNDYVSDIDEDELILTVEGNDNIAVSIDGLLVNFDSPEWYGEELMTFTVNDLSGRAIASDDVNVIVRPALYEAEITIDSATILEDEIFTVAVSTSELYEFWNVISFEFDLHYDNETIEYLGYQAGEVPNSNGMLITNNSAPGIIAVAYADAMVLTGAGDLIVFEFMAVDGGSSDITATDFHYNSTDIMNIQPGIIDIIDVNHPPVADAGIDQEVAEGEELVTLDGSGSYDPDGQTISYEWIAPEGIELSDTSIATPTFTAPEVISDQELEFTLNVSDGEFTDSDVVIIMIFNVNQQPEANAGDDQVVNEGVFVQLDGSGSYDPDEGTELVYNWTAPDGIILQNADTSNPIMIAPSVNEDTDFLITLYVSDGDLEDSDEVLISVLNAEIPDIEAEVTVTSGSGEPGEPVYINVLTSELDASWLIYSYQFSLEYNSAELSFDGYSLDNTIVNPNGVLTVTPSRGVVNVKFVSQVSSGGRDLIPISGQGSLINLEFSSFTGGQSQLDVYDFLFNAEDIDVTLPGVINNSAPFVELPIPDQTVFEDFGSITLDLNNYFSDLEDDELSYTLETGEGIECNIDGNILTINSIDNYNGTTSMTITAWDGYSDALSVTTGFNIIVTPVNDPPVIDLPEMYSFAEDSELEVDFAQFISDVDGDVLTLDVMGNENINVVISGTMITFSAIENYYGSETLTFIVSDGVTRVTASDDIIIEVTSVNDLPVADAGTPINATAGTTGIALVTLDGSGSYDIDGEIEELHWIWNDGEAFGENPEVELSVGNYTITLLVTDNEGGTDSDNVQVSVAPYSGSDPIAYPDSYSVDEDMLLTVNMTEGILANDTDDGYPEPLTALMINEPTIGTLTYNEDSWDGSFEYYAPENWNGIVTFSYVAFDGIMFSDQVLVTITVNSINDMPMADAGGPYNAVAGVAGEAMVTLSGSGSDIDGEIVLYEWYWNEELIGTGSEIIYGFAAGEYEITLVVTDNEGGTAEDTTPLYIDEYENLIPVAVDDYYTVNEDELLSINAGEGLLINDYDPDNYPEILTCELSDQRNLELMGDGSFEYMPAPDFNGSVTFEYFVTDGEAISNTATIFIEVLPVNDAPVIELPEEFTYNEDESLELDFTEYITDIDSEFLTLTVSGNVMVMVDIDDYMVTLSSETDWNGTETLTFTISDNEARLFDTDDVIVTVTAVNDAPVINSIMPGETDITIYDDEIIEFYIDAVDIDSELEYVWTFNGEIMPIIGNLFTPEFTEEGEYVVSVQISDGEYSEDVTWTVHYLLAPNWTVVTYDNFTNAHGYVTVDGLSADQGDMIGAFVNGECRGMGTVNGASRVNFYIYGNIVEVVNFKFWDLETDTIYDLDYFTQTYPGGNIGTESDPLPLSVSTGFGPGWVPTIYTNSTIVYAVVTIEGEVAENGDLVAAFVGEECRAVTEVQLMTREAIASMVVQGETVETVHFRIWDSSEDTIYNVATTIQSNPGGVVGYPPNEILLDGSNMSDITQTMNLSGGWNLVSLYVRPVDMGVESIFEPIMENLMKVKDIHNSYDPSLPPVYNTLNDLEDGSGYYVKVSAVSVLDITGSALDPNQTPIELSNGWNLVAYVNQTAMDVETAFADLIDAGVLRKVKDIFSSYDPSLPSAYNTLVNVEPGNGYYVRVLTDTTFYYPIANRNYQSQQDKLEECIWSPVIYTNSMVMYAQIDLSDSDGMILGSFVGDECRGISRIIAYNGVNMSSLVVNSEQPEEISFMIYDPTSKKIYSCKENVITNPGEDYEGMPMLTVKLDDDQVISSGITSIYPNPFNPETRISFYLDTDQFVNVKIYNIRGQLVKTIIKTDLSAGEHVLIWDGRNDQGSGCTSGVYFVRFMTTGELEIHKVILMK